MADRYWVGGTATWDGTAGTKWATSSGGGGGASVPTSADNVFLDAASGANTVTVSGTRSCANLDCTGFTGTLTASGGGNVLEIYGSMTLVSGMTYGGTLDVTFKATTTGKTITTAGKSLRNPTFDGVGGGWLLQDALTVSSTPLTLTNGALDFNGQNATLQAFASSNANARSIALGSGTIELTGNGGWNCTTSTNLTVTAGTSTIKFTNNSTNVKAFKGGGKTYNNLWFATLGTGAVEVYGSNTFNDLKYDNVGRALNFEAGSLNTVTTFTVSGTAGNLITIGTIGGGASHRLAKAGGGSISRDYLSVSWSSVTPRGDWDAGANSTNGGNNDGWLFPASTPPALPMYFGANY